MPYYGGKCIRQNWQTRSTAVSTLHGAWQRCASWHRCSLQHQSSYLVSINPRQALDSLWTLLDNIVIHAILLPLRLCCLQQLLIPSMTLLKQQHTFMWIADCAILGAKTSTSTCIEVKASTSTKIPIIFFAINVETPRRCVTHHQSNTMFSSFPLSIRLDNESLVITCQPTQEVKHLSRPLEK